MIAVVNFSPEPGSVELREIAEPTAGFGEVVVKVRAVGVCGSDLHQFHGTHSWPVNYPVALGHEFAGEIVELGEGAIDWKIGERVACETAAFICGHCAMCRTGRYNLCPTRLGFGYGTDGAMTRFVRVPTRIVHRIPRNVPYEDAAMTEPCCVAANAVVELSNVKPGDTVAVIGTGPIGLLCAQMARLFNPSRLIVIGLASDGPRLEVAKACGATEVWTTDSMSISPIADLAVDAAGASESLKPALELVKPGGQIVKVGWGPEPLGFSLDPLVQKAANLQGAFSHTWATWERVLALMSARKLTLAPLRRCFRLTEWREAFEAMESRQTVKSILIPDEDND